MLKTTTVRTTIAAILAGLSLAAHAIADTQRIDIPAGSLLTALETLAKQAEVDLVYQDAQVRGLHTGGVTGELSPHDAVLKLLQGTPLQVRTDEASGAILIMAPAQGTSESPRPQKEVEVEEVVVTGTNIRGIAPESSPSMVVDREEIDASGLQSTEQVMRSIPQVYGGSADTRTSNTGVPSFARDTTTNNIDGSGVSLRGLGAGATLTLLNGRRLASAGTRGSFVDITSIPLSAIERVEILADGASAIYGADAIAGVVNFVLKDDFQGAETQFSFGNVTEGELEQYRATQLVGTTWNSGNVIGTYEYLNRDALMPDGKDFARDTPRPFTLLPSEERHSGIVALNQDLAAGMRLSLDGYYSQRASEHITNFGSINPVLFVATEAEQFAVASGLEVDLPEEWQLRASGGHAETTADVDSQRLDLPVDLGPPSRNDSTVWSARAIADGPVMNLPGGRIRAAVGGEYRSEDFFHVDLPQTASGSRDVYAFFSEAFIPIVGPANAVPGIARLELVAALRLDHYSDFGDSQNPKFGLLWSPIKGLKLRASYGTSFNPPNLGELTTGDWTLVLNNLRDGVGVTPAAIVIGPVSATGLDPEEAETFTAGFDYDTRLGDAILSLSASYYDIKFDRMISAPPVPNGSFFNSLLFPELVPDEIRFPHPSQEFLDEIVAKALTIVDLAGLRNPDGTLDAGAVDYLFDYRFRNLSLARNSGFDFSLQLQREGKLGNWILGIDGNHIRELVRQTASTVPPVDLVDTIFNPADLRVRARIGWSRGAWSVSAFTNYTDTYADNRQGAPIKVDSYTTVDLNVRLSTDKLKVSETFKGIDVSAGATNLFNQEPPFVFNSLGINQNTLASYDAANADPMGRFVYFEIRKRW